LKDKASQESLRWTPEVFKEFDILLEMLGKVGGEVAPLFNTAHTLFKLISRQIEEINDVLGGSTQSETTMRKVIDQIKERTVEKYPQFEEFKSLGDEEFISNVLQEKYPRKKELFEKVFKNLRRVNYLEIIRSANEAALRKYVEKQGNILFNTNDLPAKIKESEKEKKNTKDKSDSQREKDEALLEKLIVQKENLESANEDILDVLGYIRDVFEPIYEDLVEEVVKNQAKLILESACQNLSGVFQVFTLVGNSSVPPQLLQ